MEFIYLAFLCLLALLASLIQMWDYRRNIFAQKEKLKEKEFELEVKEEIEKKTEIFEILKEKLPKYLSFSVLAYLTVSEDQKSGQIKFMLTEKVNRRFLDEMRSRLISTLNNNSLIITDDLDQGMIEEKDLGRISSLWMVTGMLAVASKKRNLYRSGMEVVEKVLTYPNTNKNKDEFTAMMVHELRAPLTVVRGTVDMFLRRPELAMQQQGRDLLKTLLESTEEMMKLVNDLLDVAKIEAGKFQVLKTKNNLGDLIKDRVAFFTSIANQKSIVITANITEPNLEGSFDKERIIQVINNLISNSLKFTHEGGYIVVSAQRKNSHDLQVSVTDNGVGIPTEKIPELFSKFKQIQRSSPEEKGTGLGLVVAKGIIESHGGEIWVESKLASGTTFYFTLPL